MTIAIKWGSTDTPDEPSGFVYLDCVTSYARQHRGSVTRHPVDRGASITDHYTPENPIYEISGIITGVDLSDIPSKIRDLDNQGVLNQKAQPQAVSFSQTDTGLLQFLPDSIGQFFDVGTPQPIIDIEARTDLSFEILVADLLEQLMSGEKWSTKNQRFESNIQLVEIYEFDGVNIRDITDSLVITNFSIYEDDSTGDALHLDLTLEKVKFVTLEKAQVPNDVIAATKKKKGKQDSTSKDAKKAQESGEDDAPKKDGDNLKATYQEPPTATDFSLNNSTLIGG